MRVLALECSTSSAKALLYDAEQGIVRSESEAYPEAVSAAGRIDAVAAFEMAARLGARIARGSEIAAVALCGVWHSIVLCDRAMDPVHGGYLWTYMQPSELCRELRGDAAFADEIYRRTGCMPHVTYPRDALHYLRAREGVDFSKMRLLSQGAYCFYRLTGEPLETANVASGSGLLNIHSLKYDELALSHAGIREDQLGTLARYTDALPLSAAGAKLLGLSPGIPVVPAHSDGALNQIASCAGDPTRMTMSVGTSAALRLAVDSPVLPEGHQLWSYYGVDGYMSGAAVASACNCIDWFMDRFLDGAADFEWLEADYEMPGDPPVFLPFLFGERNPGWRDERLGGFVDIRPTHTLRDMYHALQAGILFNMRQCYDVLLRQVGAPSAVCLSGGILNSGRWTQMAADVFGAHMLCEQNANASSVGAALLALHAAGGSQHIHAPGRLEHMRGVPPCPEQADRLAAAYQRYLRAYAAS